MLIGKQAFDTRASLFFENRLVYWELGLEKVNENLLFGYGAESGEYIYNKAFYENNTPLFGMIVDRSHNLFLDITLWSGIIGLIIFILWLRLASKRKIAILAWLIFASLQPLGVVHWVLLMILLYIK